MKESGFSELTRVGKERREAIWPAGRVKLSQLASFLGHNPTIPNPGSMLSFV